MILLSLSLFLQYDLLQCVEFEKVDFNGLLRAHDQNSSLRNNTQAAYQLDPHTPEFAFFTPPENFRLSPTLEDVLYQTRRSQNKHDTRHKISNIYFSHVFFKHHSRPKKHQTSTVFDTSKRSEERQEAQEKAWSDPSKELDTSERTSSESEQKTLTDNPITYASENSYPRSKEGATDPQEKLWLDPSKEHDNAERTSSESKQKTLTDNPITYASENSYPKSKEGATDPQEKAWSDPSKEHDTSERTSSESEQKTLTDNPITYASENSFPRSKEGATDPQEKLWLDPSKEHDNSERTNKESEQKPLKYNPVTYPSENSFPRSKEKATDDSESSGEPEVQRSRRPETVSPAMIRTTTHKRRLRPNLLLPKTVIGAMNPDNYADKLKKISPKRSKHDWNFDGNDVLERNKPHKDKHKGVFGDDNDIFKMMRLGKDKGKQVLRMPLTKHKKKTLTPSTDRESLTHDRNADNYADIFKKTTTPRSAREWNFDDGNDMLLRKKPHKDKHEGKSGDNIEIFKVNRLKKDKKKNIEWMHVISDTKKKKWHSDSMILEPKEETELTKTLVPTTTRQPLRQTPNNDWSCYDESNQDQETTKHKHKYASSEVKYLRAPLSKNYFLKVMEHRQEGHMVIFLIEVMQIIAKKEKGIAHDIVKHADSIIHRESKQLRWMGHPLLDVTRKIAKMLKVTDITSIQTQASNIYHQLVNRRDILPVDVNRMLEHAETMYDEDEGKVLFDVLRELVSFPDIALSSYWLCNSLINAFLRPFRRLKDTQQLKDLMVSINLALKTHDPLMSYQKKPLRSGRGFGGQAGSPGADSQPPPQKEFPIQTGPQILTPQPSWKRKSKHHHRHHKRKRDDMQLLFRQRYTQTNQRLTLTSVTPRTRVRLLFRDTTYAKYPIL